MVPNNLNTRQYYLFDSRRLRKYMSSMAKKKKKRQVLPQKVPVGGRKECAPDRALSQIPSMKSFGTGIPWKDRMHHNTVLGDEGHSCSRQGSEPIRAPPPPPPPPCTGVEQGRCQGERVEMKAAVETEMTRLKHIETALSNCFTSQSYGSHGNSVHGNAFGPIWCSSLRCRGGLWLTGTTPALGASPPRAAGASGQLPAPLGLR